MLSLDQQNELRDRYRRLHPGWRPATEVYAEMVRTQLQPGSRVLDLGCGRGGLVEQLDHPLRQVVGVDPDEQSLRQHRLPLPRLVGRGDEMPLAPATFDLVFASWVLEHMADPAHDLAHIRRVLRSGGSFVFITPNRRHPLIRLNQLVGRFSRLQTGAVSYLYGRAAVDTFPAYYRANSIATLQRLGRETGLHLVDYQVIVDPTYLAFTPALFRFMGMIEARLPAGWGIHLVGRFQVADAPSII